MRAVDKKLLPTCGRPLARSYRRSGYVDAVDSRHARIKYRGRLLYLRPKFDTPGREYRVSDFSSWTLAENWMSVCRDNSPFVSGARDLLASSELRRAERRELQNPYRSSRRGACKEFAPVGRVIVERRICRHVFYGTIKLAGEPRPKGGNCNKTDALNVSINVTGRCRCRAYIYSSRGGNSNLAHSNIEHHGGTGGGERAALLFLLAKRKLNCGGHGNREFALALRLCRRWEFRQIRAESSYYWH